MIKNLAPSRENTRIQHQNRSAILKAAMEVFSVHGFRGTTIDQIAEVCGLSKPNLLYYFPSKEKMYVALLEQTLGEWLKPLRSLDVDGDPILELERYIAEKVEMSFAYPQASRLFANEILHGGPHVQAFLKGQLRTLVEQKSATIRRWMAQGKIRPVDPPHLIFSIWAVTQHYADFFVQVEAVLGREPQKARVIEAVSQILLRGLVPLK